MTKLDSCFTPTVLISTSRYHLTRINFFRELNSTGYAETDENFAEKSTTKTNIEFVVKCNCGNVIKVLL